MKVLQNTITILILSGTLACSQEDAGQGRGGQTFAPNQNEEDEIFPVGHERPLIPIDDAFSTRISNTLAVSGAKCQGNERVDLIWDGDPVTFLCQRNQWLVTVDMENTCENNICTEFPVDPLVANLRLSDRPSPTGSGLLFYSPCFT